MFAVWPHVCGAALWIRTCCYRPLATEGAGVMEFADMLREMAMATAPVVVGYDEKAALLAGAASLRAAPAPIMGEAADALSQREASREAQGWQDISTAPRDATWVLVWSPHWRDGGLPTQVPSMAYWSHLSNCWADYDGKVYKPTVWMPLPSPPEIPS
jgi:hypothetical protein